VHPNLPEACTAVRLNVVLLSVRPVEKSALLKGEGTTGADREEAAALPKEMERHI